MDNGNCICKDHWLPDCSWHGVGTSYFQQLYPLPPGYGGERATTREQWLEFRRIQASVRVA